MVMMKTAAAALLAATAQASIGPAEHATSGLPLAYPTEVWSPRAQDVDSTNYGLYVELTFTTCPYSGPLTSFTTRCYSYMGEATFPGPTLYVRAGDALTIKLQNSLSDKDDIAFHNFWQHINMTNLHFHGGHVDADVPGDDVLTMINAHTEGQEMDSITYTYVIPEYHMAGTAWYHPHGHGSATLQTGTGSAGLIIIVDDKTTLPSYIYNAPEIHMVINHFNLGEISAFGAQTCINSDIMVPTPSGTEGSYPTGAEPGVSGIMLVNGMTNPVVTMDAGRWYRHRMLLASTMYMMNGQGVGDEDVLAGCSFMLMAKDTIYILDGVRAITKFFLFPGARADVMGKCTVPGTITFDSVYFPGQEAVTHHVPNYLGTIYTLNIVNSHHDEPMLPAFAMQRPCYLIDSRAIIGNTNYVTQKPIIYDVCELDEHSGAVPEHRKLATSGHRELMESLSGGAGHRELAEIAEDGSYIWHYGDYPGVAPAGFGFTNVADDTCESLAAGAFRVYSGIYCTNGCSFEVSYRHPVGNLTGGILSSLMVQDNDAAIAAAATVNELVGTPCQVVNPDQMLTAGDIIEWDIWGIDWHPVHFHVFPYQLVHIDYGLGDQLGNIWTEESFGEMSGGFFAEGDFGDVMQVPAKHVTLHQHLDNYATVLVNHCHILLHEDLGMMLAFLVQGEDGTKTRAQEIDPTCYWNDEEKTTFTILDTCASDADCPTGWSCPTSRRQLAFGHGGAVCTED